MVTHRQMKALRRKLLAIRIWHWAVFLPFLTLASLSLLGSLALALGGRIKVPAAVALTVPAMAVGTGLVWALCLYPTYRRSRRLFSSHDPHAGMSSM